MCIHTLIRPSCSLVALRASSSYTTIWKELLPIIKQQNDTRPKFSTEQLPHQLHQHQLHRLSSGSDLFCLSGHKHNQIITNIHRQKQYAGIAIILRVNKENYSYSKGGAQKLEKQIVNSLLHNLYQQNACQGMG